MIDVPAERDGEGSQVWNRFQHRLPCRGGQAHQSDSPFLRASICRRRSLNRSGTPSVLMSSKVTAQDVCREALFLSSGSERFYQDFRVLGDGLDDVPALFFGGGYKGADDGKVGCTGDATEAAGDFLLDLHHAPVAFGLIVGEGHGRINQEAQDVLFAI